MKLNLEHKGFTLVEMLVVVAIASIIMIAIYTYFSNTFMTAQENIKISRIEGEAKKLNDSIYQWLSMSDQTTVTYTYTAGGAKTVVMDVYQTNNPAPSAVPDIRIKITYNPANKEIIVEKNYLGSGHTPSPSPPPVYSYLKGSVERFDVVFIPADKIEIEYDVVIKRRAHGAAKRTYKVSYMLRTF